MSHLYSRGCEYALQALRALVEAPRSVCTVTQLCERADIPEHFTRKMLQPLVRAGILRSARGPGGGFTFGRDPSSISLMDVITAIEDNPRFEECILGAGGCDHRRPCPLHARWEPIQRAMRDMFESFSIADMVRADGEHTSPPVAETLTSDSLTDSLSNSVISETPHAETLRAAAG